ncbi:MAG: hypothetical protein P4L68_09065 [Methylovirgula sp.]|jgi:hypothetical protein|nr:hypothetical protein [Methylovirgula sp.]
MVQFIMGVLIGITVTISAALWADAGRAPVCPPGAGCPIVNWDEAHDRYERFREQIGLGERR